MLRSHATPGWPSVPPIPRAPPRSSLTEGTFSECLDCGWQQHGDERARRAAGGPELALHNERSFPNSAAATSLALATLGLPIRGESYTTPFKPRATQVWRAYEQTRLATRFTLPNVTPLESSSNSQ